MFDKARASVGKTYHKAGDETQERVSALMVKYHGLLTGCEARVDVLMVSSDTEPKEGEKPKPVLSCRGVPALALARVVSLRDRVKGGGDGEIQIDADAYEAMEPAERDALLDHELQHFKPKTDKNGDVKLDVLGRPKLGIREHDYDFGWFDVVARRHQGASLEVKQAKAIVRDAQGWFPFD